MTSLETLQGQMTEIDAETTRIADYIAEQHQALVDGTITADQLQENVAPRLEALRALGAPTA